jgi:hypothetical protein
MGGFKISEIILIVFAITIPLAAFAIAFIPGALAAIMAFALNEENRYFVFFGAALVVFGVLALRIYMRIRPRPKPPASNRALHSDRDRTPKI